MRFFQIYSGKSGILGKIIWSSQELSYWNAKQIWRRTSGDQTWKERTQKDIYPSSVVNRRGKKIIGKSAGIKIRNNWENRGVKKYIWR